MSSDKYPNLDASDAEEDGSVIEDMLQDAYRTRDVIHDLDASTGYNSGHVFADYDGEVEEDYGEAKSKIGSASELIGEAVAALEAMRDTIERARQEVEERELDEEEDEDADG